MSNYSKRRMVCVMPIEAVIGKMAPQDQKVNKDNAGFKCFVGYQVGNSVYNRFQVKTRPRSTSTTEDEQAIRTKFTNVAKQTRERMQNPSLAQQDMVAFSKQTKYKTFYSYVFNQVWNSVGA